jgi:hypothetical protein
MTLLVFLIEQLAIGLYVFIGVGLFLSLRSLTRARHELRATRFELQRDFARYSRANALTTFVVLIEAGLLVFGVQQFVAPTVRTTLDLAPSVEDVIVDLDFSTPTQAPLANINIDENSVALGSFDDNQIRITPTPTATPVGTIEPAPTAVGCDSEGAQLQIPANGQVIQSIVPVMGVAFTDNFSKYKLEIAGASTFGQWSTIESYLQERRTMGTLTQLNPALYEPGTYQFRLVVFDNIDTMRESCTVTIYIRPPSPTATPGGR